MDKAILLILALLIPGAALAAQSPAASGAGHGYAQSPPRAAAGRTQATTSTSESLLRHELGVSLSDLAVPDDLDVQSAEAFELKLPEEDLPDSDIPLTFNKKVEHFTQYFQNSGRASFAKWLSRSERYIPMMKTVLRREGLPEDLVYLAMIESGFTPHAYSVASAVGPWQFMPGTGKNYSLRIDPWIDERRDPLKSTVAAALYLKELYAMFKNDWYLAAAGYNAGENKILRAINMYNTRDFWEISKGEYLKRETKDYVPKLLAAAIIAKEPAKYGFADVAYLPPIEFDTVKIPSRTDLELVAKGCGVDVQTIRELNPELRRLSTPPDYPGYELKIPKGAAPLFEAEYAKIPEGERYQERVKHVAYRAKRKDTLATIAKRFKTTPQTIAELNHIGKRSRSRSLNGRLLTVPVQVASADAKLQAAQSAKSAKSAKSEPAAQPQVVWVNTYYTVKKGDTLSAIAKRFKVKAKIISTWNGMKAKVALKPGKRIIVAKIQEKKSAQVASLEAKEPAVQSAKAEPAAQPEAVWVNTYYTVKKGDTLSAIAKRFKVTAKVLSAWNNMKTKVALKPGKRIIVAKIQEKKDSQASEAGRTSPLESAKLAAQLETTVL